MRQHISFELEMAKDKYENLKKSYETLIQAYLKEYFREPYNYEKTNKKLVINGGMSTFMTMVYSYFKELRPSRYGNEHVRQATVWKSEQLLPFYNIWDPMDKDFYGSTPRTILVEKKNLKKLGVGFFKEVWVEKVKKGRTFKSLEEWFELASEEYLIENYGEKLHLMNEPRLYIKNIIIIKP